MKYIPHGFLYVGSSFFVFYLLANKSLYEHENKLFNSDKIGYYTFRRITEYFVALNQQRNSI